MIRYQKIVSIILLLLSYGLFSQQPAEQPTQPTQPPRQDVSSESPLVQIDLEDFEEAEDWHAKAT